MKILIRSSLRRTSAGALGLFLLLAATSILALRGHTQEMRAEASIASDAAARYVLATPTPTPTPTPAPTNVIVSGSTSADGGYLTLGAAFTAINGKGQTGNNITISINQDTTETASAVLNAGAWDTLTISPSGTRTITGSVFGALINLNGADNVTIDGLNSNNNSLTISNTSVSSSTYTIYFVNDATHNTVTNTTVLGSYSGAVASNGGTIFFHSASQPGSGNDNNTISNNNLGPSSAGLPTQAIGCNGTTTSKTTGNSGNVINNNNIYDYFSRSGTSAGFSVIGGCTAFSVTNNRFYQTAARSFTTGSGSQHFPIWVNAADPSSGAESFTITGNTIGYSSSAQTGVYSMSGGGSSSKFVGIYFNGLPSGAATTISNNTIASISVTNSAVSGNLAGTPFSGIVINSGSVAANGNLIGSPTANGSLSLTTSTNSAIDIYGIYNFTTIGWTTNGNVIGGITYSNALASTGSVMAGLSSRSTGTFTYSSNQIVDLIANVGTVNGILVSNAGTGTVQNNMIAVGQGITSNVSVNGIQETAGNNNFYHNSIYVGGSPTSGSSNSFALGSTSTGTGTRAFKDNIFVNNRSNAGASGKNYVIQVGGSGTNQANLTIDNNYYYSSGTGSKFGLYNGLDITNLSGWKSAVGKDVNSSEGDPLFVDPTNASAPNLHLQQTSPAINKGVAVEPAVTTDIDGDARPLYSGYDIGADEVVDTTAPETSITSGPTTLTSNTSASFEFTGTDNGPAASSAISFECSLDFASFAACSSSSGQTYSGISSGAHTFQVRAKDAASNVDASPASYSWTVDATAPETTIDGNKPADPTNLTSATFSFSGTDAGSGVSSYACRFDTAAFAACTSPVTSSGLLAGTHSFEVRSTDGVGNTDPSPASYTWTIDTMAPSIAAYSAITSSDSTSNRALSVNVTDNVAVSSVSLYYSVNGAAQSPVDCGVSRQCSIPGQPTGSIVTYYVHAIDTAGNSSDSPSASAPDLYTVGTTSITSGTYSRISLYEGSTIGPDVMVTDTLDLRGVISTGANTLHLGCDAVVTNAGSSSYVIGKIQKDFCSTGSFSFPTGTAANGFGLADTADANAPLTPEYSPVAVNITSVSGASSLTVNTTDDYLSGLVTSTAVSRYWTLTAVGNITADLTFTYLDEDIHGSESGYHVFKRENGNDSQVGGTVNEANNTVTVTGVTSFSDWGIGTALAPTGAEVQITGRVTAADGSAVQNAGISLSAPHTGVHMQAITNPFGYFLITGLEAGETYVINVSSKRFTFANPNKVVTLDGNAADLLFVADPE